MSPETEKCMNQMVDWAREGNEVIPMYFSIAFGRATISAAVRAAKKRGLLVECDRKDGTGKPKYRAPSS